jgi:hypothetical protein
MVPTVMAVSSGVITLCLIGLTSYLTTNLQSLSSEPKIAWGHGYMDKAYDHLVRKPVKPPHFRRTVPSLPQTANAQRFRNSPMVHTMRLTELSMNTTRPAQSRTFLP